MPSCLSTEDCRFKASWTIFTQSLSATLQRSSLLEAVGQAEHLNYFNLNNKLNSSKIVPECFLKQFQQSQNLVPKMLLNGCKSINMVSNDLRQLSKWSQIVSTTCSTSQIVHGPKSGQMVPNVQMTLHGLLDPWWPTGSPTLQDIAGCPIVCQHTTVASKPAGLSSFKACERTCKTPVMVLSC